MLNYLYNLFSICSNTLTLVHLHLFQMHKKILDKGVPEDAQPGIKNAKVSIKKHISLQNNFILG